MTVQEAHYHISHNIYGACTHYQSIPGSTRRHLKGENWQDIILILWRNFNFLTLQTHMLASWLKLKVIKNLRAKHPEIRKSNQLYFLFITFHGKLFVLKLFRHSADRKTENEGNGWETSPVEFKMSEEGSVMYSIKRQTENLTRHTDPHNYCI